MSSNSRQQTTVFSTVEQEMTEAEAVLIDATKVPVHTPCNPAFPTTTRAQSANCGTPLIPILAESMCTPIPNATGQLVQAPLLAGSRPSGFPDNATIMSVSCLQDTRNIGILEHLCSSIPTASSTTPQCYPDDNPANPVTCTSQSGTNGTVTGTVVTNTIPAGSTWPCYRPFQSDSAGAQCPTELYTIRITITDPDNNAQRTVESRYAVDCGTVSQ